MSDGLYNPASIDLGIQNVHVISGEDIIGHTFLTTDPQTGIQTYKIEKPVMPNIGLDQTTGNYRVGLLPLRPYLDKAFASIDVLSGHVIYCTPVTERLKDMYRQFTSDIVVATPTNLNSLLHQS